MGIKTWFPTLVVCMSVAHLVQAHNRATASTSSHNKHVVCYWGTWSNYRASVGKFTVDNLDPNLCTHIIYSFAGLDANTNEIKSLDPWLDLGEGSGTGLRGFLNTSDLKYRNPKLKVTLAIGGWNEGSARYSKMARDASKRATFVKSVLKMLRDYNFDGLDLDWEYPGKRGGSPEDKKNFILLIKDLKRALKPNGLILTAAIGAAPGTIDAAYDVPQMYEHLDLVHVMCYDYHGSWDEKTGHNAPLRAKPHATGNDLKFTIEYTWKHLKAKGAIAEKTVMGVPFYGRTFTLINPHDARMGARATKTGFAGPYTKENGFLGYNEVCETLGDSSSAQKPWKREWDDDCQAPFMHSGLQWVGYDDQESITKKVDFAMDNDMAGVMVWSVDTDDFLGKCGPRYPLLTAINEALVHAGSGASTSNVAGASVVIASAIVAVFCAII